MKTKLTHRLWAKVVAVILLIVSAVAAVAAGVGVLYCASTGIYSTNNYFQSDICYSDAHSVAYEAAEIFYYSGLDVAQTYLDELEMFSNAHVRILDIETGEILAASSYPAAVENKELTDLGYYRGVGGFAETFTFDYRWDTWQEEVDVREYANEVGETIYVPEIVERSNMAEDAAQMFNVVVAVASPLENAHDTFYQHARFYSAISTWRYAFLGILGGGALLALICFIFLLCAAGHREGVEGIVLNGLDQVPLDLLTAVYVTVWTLVIVFLDSITGQDFFWVLGSACVAAVLAIALILSFAARVKAGKFWQNTVLWRLWKWLVRVLRRCGSILRRMYGVLPMIWKAVLLLVGLVCVEFFLLLCALNTGFFFVLLFLLFNFVLFLALCFGIWQLSMLKKAGKALASGNFDYKLDTKHMYWEFREHGDNLNAIGTGMAIAVEQKMRSERLKTELITNVSHDIKTPLTSIVSYVDLMQRPDLTEEQRQEYLEVLARQSARLKKLTEDLVEASKASTGNMQVTLVPTSVEELVNQAVAEYSERLAAGKLDVIVSVSDKELSVMADGRLLWRVLDNLLNNVSKYALSDTRVYLTAVGSGDTVNISVKNISRDPLNVSEEELMERFVRGDTSRTTEGSGLGLNIARSLTQLQGGTFELTIDGDLFKAEIVLGKAK